MKLDKLVSTVILCTVLNLNVFSQDGVTVALSTTTIHGFGIYYYGIEFGLKNVDTDVIYRSKSLNRINPENSRHNFIKDLPKGKYEMIYIGTHENSNVDSVVVKFFGMLDFTKHNGYYLGDFRGKRPVGWNTPWYLKELRMNVPHRLTKVLRRRGYIDKGEDLFTGLTYSSSNLVLPPLR